MSRLLTIFFVIILTILASCGGKEVKSNGRPDWIDNPGDNFVGKCGTHVNGRIAQERCAYEKGLAYMAMAKGVKVDVSSQTTMKQTATQKTGSSYGRMESKVNMNEKNIKVKGKIVDKWYDRNADIVYVLIKEE